MTATLAPTTDLVMKSWLMNTVGIANAGPVLPSDESKWSADGFVQVMTVGGAPEVYTRIRKPLVQFDFWAVSPGSNKAPWGQANALAEEVIAASYVNDVWDTSVSLGGNFMPARLLSIVFVSEPRRIYDQANDSARFTADAQVMWVA